MTFVRQKVWDTAGCQQEKQQNLALSWSLHMHGNATVNRGTLSSNNFTCTIWLLVFWIKNWDPLSSPNTCLITVSLAFCWISWTIPYMKLTTEFTTLWPTPADFKLEITLEQLFTRFADDNSDLASNLSVVSSTLVALLVSTNHLLLQIQLNCLHDICLDAS